MNNYILEIPRPQFDRIADAVEHQVFDVNEFDFDKDTIIFTIKEPLRVWFENYAVLKIIKWKGGSKKNPYTGYRMEDDQDNRHHLEMQQSQIMTL